MKCGEWAARTVLGSSPDGAAGRTAVRRRRARWTAIAGCLVGLLVGCTAQATGPDAGQPSAIATSTAAAPLDGPAPTPVKELQLNLCNSGEAGCYTGRSITQAATTIRATTPDLVTLNEICQSDLPALQQALTDAWPNAQVASVFAPALDRRTGEPYRCQNGQSYGIGLVSRWPAVPGSAALEGIYPTQDTHDPEERAWVCLRVEATPNITACTTHLADTKRDVAIAQCKYVFDAVITRMRDRDPAAPVVLGGDLNLGSAGSHELKSCLPTGSAVADDGGVQLVVASPGFVVTETRRIDLQGTTDHPGLLVTLAPDGQR